MGQIPVILTLIVIAIYFETQTGGIFLNSRNLTNLVQQIVTIGTVSLAAVLVLLIGEIDLSLASVAYFAGGIMAVLSVNHHVAAGPAIILALLVGLLVGLINGVLVAIVRVPSFIVTLAGSIFYFGLLLHILSPNTSVAVLDPAILALQSNYLEPVVGIVLPLAIAALYALTVIRNRIRRERRGLKVTPWSRVVGELVLMFVLVIAVVAIFSNYLGVPLSAAILVGLILIFWLVMRFTTFGRHVYAVGGNAEAARRAGISVVGIRIAVFALASTLAAAGGILETSRQTAAQTQIDQTLLLNAIAAAVIGGVSLFGGRGSVWAVVLGALVIGSIANGLTLMSQPPDVQQIVEGAVLIVAVTADALLRRRSAISGR